MPKSKQRQTHLIPREKENNSNEVTNKYVK